MNSYQLMKDLELYAEFEAMIQRRLAEIPTQSGVSGVGKAEDIAEERFHLLGFHVFRSRARNGYRCLVDWATRFHNYSAKDKAMVNLIHTTLQVNEFHLLVNAIRDKVGTPDLLLLKDKAVSFVEVKQLNEEVQPCTIKFFLRYNHLWPLSILRVDARRPVDELAEEFSS